MPRFDDDTIDMQELLRRLAEQVVNAVMDAEADQLCGGANSRNGYRERALATCVGTLTRRQGRDHRGPRRRLEGQRDRAGPSRPHLRRARDHARARVQRLRLRRHRRGARRGGAVQPAFRLRPDQGRRRHRRGRVPAPLHHALQLGHRRGAQLRQDDEVAFCSRGRPRGRA